MESESVADLLNRLAASHGVQPLESESLADLATRLAQTQGVPLSPGPESGANATVAVSLAEYRGLVRALPPPEPRQITAFAEYVSSCHSWYKHLPPIGSGVRFTFLISPCAMMMDVPPRSDDLRTFRPYVSDKERIHYATMLTEEYRERFGWLAYFAGDDPASIPIPVEMSSGAEGVVLAQLRRVPDEIQTASAQLTSAIHPLTAQTWLWFKCPIDKLKESSRVWWPAESGGIEQLERIVMLSRQIHDSRDFGEASRKVEAELKELLRPERERQLQLMIEAIQRLKHLLWD